jgi:hypothetical protein
MCFHKNWRVQFVDGVIAGSFFHGLFSTVCNDFSTNPRKQAQPSFTEITYENGILLTPAKPRKTTFLNP